MSDVITLAQQIKAAKSKEALELIIINAAIEAGRHYYDTLKWVEEGCASEDASYEAKEAFFTLASLCGIEPHEGYEGGTTLLTKLENQRASMRNMHRYQEAR